MSELEISKIIFIASGALSFLSAPLFSLFLIPLAKKWGAIDVPSDQRRMHSRPVARIGGVAIFFSFLLGALPFIFLAQPFFTDSTESAFMAAALGGGVILLGGLADDIYKLSPWQKMLFQLLAALVAAAFGITADGSPLYVVFGIFLCVFLSNAFNLIDGLDGLCSGVGAFALLGIALTGGELLAVISLSAVLGFLPLNMRPARLFLGDSGSMLIGFWAAVFALNTFSSLPTARAAAAMLLMLALPVVDTCLSAARRILSGKSPFSPDRKHVHHRLVDGGLSHGHASLLLVLLSGGISSVGALVYEVGFSPVCLILSSLLIFPAAFVIIISTKKPQGEKKDDKGYEKS